MLDERATLWGAHTFNEDSHLASSTYVRRTSACITWPNNLELDFAVQHCDHSHVSLAACVWPAFALYDPFYQRDTCIARLLYVIELVSSSI